MYVVTGFGCNGFFYIVRTIMLTVADCFPVQYLITRTREKLPRSDHIGNVEAEDKLVAWLEEQLRMHGLV